MKFVGGLAGLVGALVGLYMTVVSGADNLNVLADLITRGGVGDRLGGFAGGVQLALLASGLLLLVFFVAFFLGFVVYAVFEFFDVGAPRAAAVLFVATIVVGGAYFGIVTGLSAFWMIWIGAVAGAIFICLLGALFLTGDASNDADVLFNALIAIVFLGIGGGAIAAFTLSEAPRSFGGRGVNPADVEIESFATIFVPNGGAEAVTDNVTLSSTMTSSYGRYSDCAYVLATPVGLFEGVVDLSEASRDTPASREHIQGRTYYKVSLVGVDAAGADRGCTYTVGVGRVGGKGASAPRAAADAP